MNLIRRILHRIRGEADIDALKRRGLRIGGVRHTTSLHHRCRPLLVNLDWQQRRYGSLFLPFGS